MPFEIVLKQIKNTEQEILQELIQSLRRNNVIGILLKGSKELINTAVVKIEDDDRGQRWVILKQHDLHGSPLRRTRFPLSSIDRVIRFNIPFNDPRYRDKRKR
ncbi:MAG: hypothetical protein ACOYXT_09945 [Bacteroidota bacterium]